MKFIGRNMIIFLMICQTYRVLGQNIDQMGCGVEGCSHRIQSLWKSTFIETKNYDQWDLTYNKLELNVDPAVRYISGSVRFEFVSKVNLLSEITIDLSNTMVVDSIKARNFFPLKFVHNANQVEIELKDTLSENDHCCFKVYYHGVPSESGFGAFIIGNHNDTPVMATLSEPYGALEWWPCKQSLQDKIDSIDLIVHSPKEYLTASNGILMADSVFGDYRTNHWQHRHPIATYLVAIAVTNFVQYSDYAHLSSGDSVEILNYVYPESLDLAKQETKKAEWMLEFFSEIFMDYPFKDEKYGHAQFPWGGGMEHQTMSFMGFFQYEIIAHELAHQWFGDYVTCGSWQDIWLNEGFATYLTGLCYEHSSPDFYWPIWKRKAIEKVVKEPDGAVFVEDTTNVGRIFSSRLSYYKASVLLHMLRGQLGDSAFFTGIKNYLNDERVANGFARTHHLKENLEQAADTTLIEFFNDWFYGEGYPVYAYGWSFFEGGLELNLSQTTSVLGGSFFEMKIPVVLWQKGEKETYWLHHKTNNQNFQISLSQEPDSVQIDPDMWLLAKWQNNNLGIDEKKLQFKCYPNPVTDELTIESCALIGSILGIHNLDGKLIKRFSISNCVQNIDVSGLAAGSYFLTINYHNTIIKHKWFKL